MAAVLAAGGRGERLGRADGVSKQFVLLAGKPIYLWSLETLYKNPRIDKIVVVSPRHMLEQVEQDMQKYCSQFAQKILVTEGGASRQKSVHLGLEMLAKQAVIPDHVLMHDAARPFISREAVDQVLDALRSCKGATLAIPVSDTVKRGRNSMIVDTIDRNDLYLMQTPQAAHFKVLLQAHRQAQDNDWQVTDDVALLEKTGVPVKIVIGSNRNFKITNEDDLRLAEEIA